MDMYYMTSKRGRGLPPQNVSNTYVYFILQFFLSLLPMGPYGASFTRQITVLSFFIQISLRSTSL